MCIYQRFFPQEVYIAVHGEPSKYTVSMYHVLNTIAPPFNSRIHRETVVNGYQMNCSKALLARSTVLLEALVSTTDVQQLDVARCPQAGISFRRWKFIFTDESAPDGTEN